MSTGLYAIPGSMSPGVFNPGDLGISSSSSGKYAFYFSAVPAVGIPGLFTIGSPAAAPTGFSYYNYIGHYILYYLDYIDLIAMHTLVARPGNIYSMFAVNGRKGLSDPPADGRWGIPSAPSWDDLILPGWHEIQQPNWEIPGEIHQLLIAAKAVNADMQAAIAKRPYWQAATGKPQQPVHPEITPQMQENSKAVHAAKAQNSDLQAQRYRESMEAYG